MSVDLVLYCYWYNVCSVIFIYGSTCIIFILKCKQFLQTLMSDVRCITKTKILCCKHEVDHLCIQTCKGFFEYYAKNKNNLFCSTIKLSSTKQILGAHLLHGQHFIQ